MPVFDVEYFIQETQTLKFLFKFGKALQFGSKQQTQKNG